LEGRLDTCTAFNIDWPSIDAASGVRIAEGGELEASPAEDGERWPSFAGVFRIGGRDVAGPA
jgi:hypothetical protein